MSHLAFLIPTIDRIGGAERQALLLAEEFAKRGWRVSLVALSGSGGNAALDLSSAGIGFLSLEMRKGLADPRGWLGFHRWLSNARPDILHAHLPHAAWMARWSRLAAPVRVVVDSIHTSAIGSTGRRFGYRISAWLPDRVSAVSHAAAQAWLSAAMVRANQLTVVPNGIDMSRWKPDCAIRASTRGSLGVSSEFLWFAAGRLEPVKDFPALLRAFKLLPSNAALAIAGEGSQLTRLQQLADELGIAPRVRFLGFRPDVLPWMQSADGFVQTSRWEGLPTALLEAAACELPAVATAVDGTCEVIAGEETGLLAPPNDVPALAAAMSRLMQMPPAERCAMGRRARQFAGERFSLPAVADRWEALYLGLLDRNSASRRWGR